MKETDNDLQSYNGSLRFLPFTNDTGETIPAHGLMELVGDAGERGFIALKPRTDNCFCFLNGPVAVPTGHAGQTYAGIEGLIVATDGTAAAEEEWGAAAGSWLATSGKKGFVAMADGEGSLAYVRRLMPTGGSGGQTWVKITGGATLLNKTTYAAAGNLTTFDPATGVWSDVSGSVYIAGNVDGLTQWTVGGRYEASPNGTITITGTPHDFYTAMGDVNASAVTDGPGVIGTGAQNIYGVKNFWTAIMCSQEPGFTKSYIYQTSTSIDARQTMLGQDGKGTSAGIDMIAGSPSGLNVSSVTLTYGLVTILIAADSTGSLISMTADGSVNIGTAQMKNHGLGGILEFTGVWTTAYRTFDGAADVAGVSGTLICGANIVTVVNGLITNIA